ncbi:MAG: hypothetical protein AAF371_14655 [Pseudomonadota bacterium]
MPTIVALALPPALAVTLALTTALITGIEVLPSTGCTPATCGGGAEEVVLLSGTADHGVAAQ